MGELISERIKRNARELKLYGLAETADELVDRAEAGKLGYREFLDLVLESEVGVLEGRRYASRLKLSGLPHHKTLDEFDGSFKPAIEKKQIFDLATGRFVREARDVLSLGPPGVGKSFLVQALGYQALKAGFLVLYRSIFDVVRDFLHDEALGGEDKVLARYLKPDLLIVDDMGMKQLPKRSGEYLFEVIHRRYELRSTVMTSNRPLEDWGKALGDVPTATAILDRFLHRAEIIAFNGRSYRLKDKAEKPTPAAKQGADKACKTESNP